MYTDNPQADRQLLERTFDSSLLKDVVAVEAYEYLEVLKNPDTVAVRVRQTPESVNDACRMIINDLGSEDAESHLVVGYDSEWNVEYCANGRFQHHGPTAIIQLAYRNRIDILQVCSHLNVTA